MPSITLSQLRDTRRLRSWLRAGKTVELRERKTLIAYIIPEKRDRVTAARGPDHTRRNREVKAELDKILRRVDKLPTLDSRSADEIIGYDEHGLPH